MVPFPSLKDIITKKRRNKEESPSCYKKAARAYLFIGSLFQNAVISMERGYFSFLMPFLEMACTKIFGPLARGEACLRFSAQREFLDSVYESGPLGDPSSFPAQERKALLPAIGFRLLSLKRYKE